MRTLSAPVADRLIGYPVTARDLDALPIDAFAGLADLAAHAAGTPFAGVFVLGSDGRRRGRWNVPDRPTLHFVGTPSGMVLATGERLIVPGLADDPRFSLEAYLPEQLGVYAGVPVLHHGRAVGVVCALSGSHGDWEPDEPALRALEVIAQQVITHLEAAQALGAADVAARERAHTQRELARSRGRLQAVVSGLADGVLLVSEHREVLVANDEFCRLMGLPERPADLVGAHMDFLVPRLRAAYAAESFSPTTTHEIMAGGVPVRGMELKLADGRVIERDYAPIVVDGGQRGHLWHHRDITARRHAQKALAASERHYSVLAQAAPMSVFRVGLDGAITHYTPSWAYRYGLPDMGATASDWGRVVHEEDRPGARDAIYGALTRRAALKLPLRLRTVDGDIRNVTLALTPLAAVGDEEEGYLGTVTDTTDELRATRALRVSEGVAQRERERLEATIEGALDSIVGLDGEARITDLNPAAQRRFRSTSKEAHGQPLADLVVAPAIDLTELHMLAAPPDKGQERTRLDVTCRDRLGATFPAEMVVVEAGEGCLTLFIRDVTAEHAARAERERRLVAAGEARRYAEEAQAELARQNAELAELSRAKDDFLAALSHELRTPLTSIRTFVELLGADPDAAEATQEPLAVIARNAERLERLVADLLTVKTGEAEMPTLVPTDLRALALEAVASLEPRAAATGVALAVEGEGEVLAHADGARLGQVLDNLLDNAVKASPDGGAVTIGFARAGDGRVRMTVADRGVGIAAAELPSIFDQFFQAEHGRSLGRGSGLGLAIARTHVAAQGGTITVTSEEGRGTTFAIELAAADGGD